VQSSFEGFITLQNANVFVKRFGSKGPDLIFIHGGPGWDHSYFLPFVLPLASNFKLIFFDLRDCGRSFSKKSENRLNTTFVDACTEDLFELLQKLELKNVDILGFSFGGRVAMRFAELNPNYIHRLILASTTYSSDYKELLNSKDQYKELMTPEALDRINQLWRRTGDQSGSITRELASETLKFNIHKHMYLDIASKVLQGILFNDLWGAGYSTEKNQLLSKRDYVSR